MGRHLEALRAADAHRPGLHRHQLAALEAGATAELARAGWLDRLAAEVRVALAVGDPARATAAAMEHADAVAAAPGEWMSASRDRTAELRRASEQDPGTYARLLVAVARAAAWGATNLQIAGSLAGVRLEAAAIDEDAPPCHARAPWDGLVAMARAELDAERSDRWGGGASGAPAPMDLDPDPAAAIDAGFARYAAGLRPDPPDSAPAEAALVAAPYRAMADAYPEGDPSRVAAERAAAAAADGEDAADALAILAERNLLTGLTAAPWRVQAERGLAHQAEWPDVLVEHHWTSLTAALDEARSPTEVELVTMHADACFAVERDWNAAFHVVIVAPALGAYIGDAGGAVRMAHAVTGLGPAALTATPRVQQLLAHCLGGAQLGVGREGEAGFELLQAILATEATAAPHFDAAADPPADPRTARLWGHEIDLREPFPQPRRPGV